MDMEQYDSDGVGPHTWIVDKVVDNFPGDIDRETRKIKWHYICICREDGQKRRLSKEQIANWEETDADRRRCSRLRVAKRGKVPQRTLVF